MQWTGGGALTEKCENEGLIALTGIQRYDRIADDRFVNLTLLIFTKRSSGIQWQKYIWLIRNTVHIIKIPKYSSYLTIDLFFVTDAADRQTTAGHI